MENQNTLVHCHNQAINLFYQPKFNVKYSIFLLFAISPDLINIAPATSVLSIQGTPDRTRFSQWWFPSKTSVSDI